MGPRVPFVTKARAEPGNRGQSLLHTSQMPAFVYILTSNHGTLYTGCTDDLHRRVFEHRNGIHSRFASKYGCHRLAWFEECATLQTAYAREQQIKGWTRARKLALIQQINPEYRDLAEGW